MKLTNGEIFNAKEPLQKLLAEKPPFAVSYGLAILASKLEPQLGVIEKVRTGLFQTYGYPNPDNPQQLLPPKPMISDGSEIKDEDGNPMKDGDGNPLFNMVENPQAVKFVSEYNELMSKEVEIVIDVVEIPSTVELKIEPTVLLALLKFIKMVKK